MSKVSEAMKAAGVVIAGNLLLVERLVKEEIKTKSGLVIADASGTYANTIDKSAPVLVKVLAVGEGFYTETGDIPLDTNEDDVLLVGPHAVQWFSSFPGLGLTEEKIGLVKETEIQISFGRGLASYTAALNEASEGKA